MTTFDDRQKGYESKFAHDEELNFKAGARRNKLLGLWAAARLGKNGAEAEAYAKEVVLADFDKEGDGDVLEKILHDFKKAAVALSDRDIRAEMECLLPVARQQIMSEKK